jgi:hypothetical protein
MDGKLTRDLHREKLDGVVDGELTGDLLGEVFDEDDLDGGGAGEGCLDCAKRSKRGDKGGAGPCEGVGGVAEVAAHRAGTTKVTSSSQDRALYRSIES